MRSKRAKSIKKWSKLWCKAHEYPWSKGVYRRFKKEYMQGALKLA